MPGCTATPRRTSCAPRLADRHGVAPANVMIGEGIDGLLGNLVRLW
jgi:histidinol-phosphate aminotransferase